MPIVEDAETFVIVRQARAVRGTTKMECSIRPSFDYARAPSRVVRQSDGTLTFDPDADCAGFHLTTDVAIEAGDDCATGSFVLRQGETRTFVLHGCRDTLDEGHDLGTYFSHQLDATMAYWHEWLSNVEYEGQWDRMVHRSLLVLKLLFSDPWGSLVAAPTFGLPERHGLHLNWDYRFTWIRDTALCISALMDYGFLNEAERFIEWLVDRVLEHRESDDSDQPLQVLYRIDGGTNAEERELDHLDGWKGARPVHIGNAAYSQLQLDAYGELLRAIDVFDTKAHAIHHDLWIETRMIVDWVCENWSRADAGIWEPRTEPHRHLHSHVMCWTAIDRGLAIAERRSLPADIIRWRDVATDIYECVWDEFWDEERQAFDAYLGAGRCDASSLMMPQVGFVSAHDPRWLAHLRALEDELVDDILVHRNLYTTEMGTRECGPTFTACSFWFVENLALSGRVERSRLLIEKMFAYANHLELYSEQIGAGGEFLGNFPLALSHLALLNAVARIETATDEEGRRPRSHRHRV